MACGYGGVDCLAISQEQDVIIQILCVITLLNDYYQKNLAHSNCVFGGTTQLTCDDPGMNLHQTNSSHNSHSAVDEVPNIAY